MTLTAAPARTPAGPTAAPAPHRRTRVLLTFLLLGTALVVLAVVSAGVGQLHVPPAEVLGSLLHRIGLDVDRCPPTPTGTPRCGPSASPGW